MKIKLFRIVSLLFILSSLLSLVIVVQPTYADNPVQNPPPPRDDGTPTTPTSTDFSGDPAVQQQAIAMIAQCKNAVIPADPNSTCGKYHGCLNQPNSSDLCKGVKSFDGKITPLSSAALAGCKKAKQKEADCYSAYGTCLNNRIDDGKVSDDDTKACTDLITKGDLDGAKKDPDAKKTSCVIQGIGWLICPVMTLLSKIVDAAYLFVSSLLTVQPLLTDTSDAKNSVYQAWVIMRNIANVAFVIAFLVIILSQVSSIGISNYGIKKLLPRIIVSAILVNVSYWICAIAVDVSNILGISFNGLFESIGAKVTIPDAKAFGAQGVGWEGFTGGILAGTLAVGVLYVSISALMPALVVALLAIVVVFLVLTLRQALIILLIVIAPLAFVAYLLPNTEGWFKKWRELFQTMLLMYPIIAIIFGTSALASKIVMASASGPYKIAVQIMGAAISIIPLAITPVVMKSAGGLLNRFGGIINNPNRGPFDRLKKGAESLKESSKVNRGLRALDPNKFSMPGRRRAINFGNRRRAVKEGRAEQFQDMKREDIARMAKNNPDFAQKVAGDKASYYQAKQEQYLASVDPGKLALEVDKSKIANAVDNLRLSVADPANAIKEHGKTLAKAVQEGDSVTARAAQQLLMSSGKTGKGELREQLSSVDAGSEVGTQLRKDLSSSDIKGSAADIYKWSNDSGHRSLTDVASDKGTWEGLSETQIQGQIEKSLEAAVGSGGVSQERARAAVTGRGAESMGAEEKEILRTYAGPGPGP